MSVRTVVPSFRRALPAIALVVLLLLLLAPAALAEDSFIEPVPVDNTAGRLDTASLYDLGDNTAALHAFLSDNSSFTRVRFWKSAVGAFDTAKAKLAYGDLNADGKPDALVLYDRGSGISALYAFLNTGTAYVKTTAWKGTLTWSRAKLCVADIDGDGSDDAYVLYKTGLETASVQGFLSTISETQTAGVNKVVMTKKRLWPSQSYLWDRAKVAATDADGDGRDDLVSLYRTSLTTARVDVFRSSGTAVVKEKWWKGDFKAAKSKLACGDLDSDGYGEAFVLYDRGDASSSLRVFKSTGSAYLAPATWWKSAIGALNWWTTKLACGDVTSDGKADAVLLSKKSLTECRVRVGTSTGSAFSVASWWVGSYRYGRAAIACAPSTPTVIPETTEVLEPDVVAGMTTADGETYVFSDVARAAALVPGDVIVGLPSESLPEGVFRKVVAVNGSAVLTEHAFLEDAIADGEFSFDRPLSRTEFAEEAITGPGVELLPEHLQSDDESLITLKLTDWEGELDTYLAKSLSLDTTLGLVTYSGTITVGISVHISACIKNRRPVSFEFVTTRVVETDLSVSVGSPVSVSVSKPLFTWGAGIIPGITLMVGPVPLYFQPEGQFIVGVSGELEAGLKAGVGYDSKETCGFVWTSGQEPRVIHSDEAEWSTEPLTAYETNSLKAFAGVKIAFKLYACAGPYGQVDAYFKLKSDPSQNPWLTLQGGAELSVGVEASVHLFWLNWGMKWEALGVSLGVWHLLEIAISPPPPPEPTPSPTPTPTPTPTPSVTSTPIVGEEFAISIGTGKQRARAAGDVVVWQDSRNGDWDIYGYDLSKNTELPLCIAPGDQTMPSIDGNLVVWQDSRNGNWDIYGCNLSDGTEFPICTHPRDQVEPDVWADWVVWEDHRNEVIDADGYSDGQKDVYGLDLSSGGEYSIATSELPEYRAAIDADRVVWFEECADWETEWSHLGVYVVSERRLLPSIGLPAWNGGGTWTWIALSGSTSAWCPFGYYGPSTAVWTTDISTGQSECVVPASGGPGWSVINLWPRLSGRWLVWYRVEQINYGDFYLTTYTIEGCDLWTRVCFKIADGKTFRPDVSGDLVVWHQDYPAGVYGCYLE